MKRSFSLKRLSAALLVLFALVMALPTTASASTGATRAELAQLVYEKFDVPAVGGTAAFNDIGGCSADQKEAISGLTAAGIMSGHPDGRFDPEGPVDRGMAALIIWRAMGKPTSSGETTFTDLPETGEVREAVIALKELGIVNGNTTTEFGVAEEVTGAQASALLSRVNLTAVRLTLADGKARYAAGDTVTVKAALATNTAVSGMTVNLTYDSDVVTLTGTNPVDWVKVDNESDETTVPYAAVNSAAAGVVRMAYVGSVTSPSEKELFTATFTVNEDVTTDAATFGVAITDAVNQNAASVSGLMGAVGTAYATVEQVPVITDIKAVSGPKVQVSVSGCVTGESYELYRDGVKVADATAEGDALTLTDATAQTGQRYTYTVRARYAAGLVGTLSGERSFEIPLVDAPELTSWEGTYIDSPAVALEWTAVSAAGGTVKYQLYRNDGSGWAAVGGLLEASSYNDTTVPAGVLCTYSVRAVLVLSDGTEIPGVFDSEGVSVYVPVLPAPTWESEPTLTDGAVISMNWNEVPGADGYRVVRFVDHQENLEVDLPADVTEYIDADVEIGTAASYTYLIVPLKEDGYDTATGENLQWSGEIMIAPFLAAPNALAVEELRDRSVLLSWSHPQGYTYVVEVLEDDVVIGSYVVKSDTPTLDTAKVKPLENDLLQECDAILELKADTTYTVRVSGAGVSRDGEDEIVGYLRGRYTEISFTTKPAAPALDEPVLRTNLLAGLHVFAFGVDLSWDGEGYDGYVIERNGVQVATLSGGDTSWSDNDAVSGELTYTLRGYTMESGARVFSGPAACTIEIPSLGRRATITGKIQLDGGEEIPVVEVAGGEDDYDDVLIAYRQPGGEWDYALHENAVFGGGVTYQVRAAAYKTVDGVTYLGPWSDIREDRYGQLPAPAVEQLSLVRAGTALEARWPAVDGYDGYAVYLNGAHVDSVSASEVVVGPNKLFCTLAGLTSGRQYEVYVRGYNIVNGKTVLGAMPEGEAKKSYTIPAIAAPGWNSATNGEGNYAQLNWQKLTVDGFTVGYELSRTVKGGRTAEPVVLKAEQYSVGDTHISYQDITVAPVTYTYQVRACILLSDDTVYCGPWSAPSEEVVLGGFGVSSTVRNVQAVTVDGTTIKVSWDKVDGAVGYEIYRLTEAYTSPDQLTAETLLKKDGLTALTYDDKTAVQGTVYTYAVWAYYVKDGQRVYNNAGTAEGCIRKAALTIEGLQASPTKGSGSLVIPLEGELDNTEARPQSLIIALDGKKVEEIKELAPFAARKGITLTGLKPESEYILTVTASYKLPSGKVVSTVYTETVTTGRPDPVTNVTAEAYSYDAKNNTGTIQVTWTPVEGAEGYYVHLTGEDRLPIEGATAELNISTLDVKGGATTSAVVSKSHIGGAPLALEQNYVVAVVPYWTSKGSTVKATHTERFDDCADGVPESETDRYAVCAIPDVSAMTMPVFTVTWEDEYSVMGLKFKETGGADPVPQSHGYAIYRKEGDTASSAKFTLVGYMGIGPSGYGDMNAQRNMTYTYSVRPYVKLADGKYYEGNPYMVDGVEGVSAQSTNLHAPTSVTADVVDGSTIRLMWNTVAEATSYIVERVEPTGTVTKVGTVTQTAGKGTYYLDDVKAVQGVNYTYRVYAATKTLTSAAAEVEKSIPAPDKVTDVEIVSVTPTTVELRVTMENDGEAAVFVKEGTKWGWAQYDSQDGNTYMVSGLIPGTDYTFAVRGVCAPEIGDKKYTATTAPDKDDNSETLDVTTASAPKAEQTGATEVWIKWEDAKGAYNIYRVKSGEELAEDAEPINDEPISGGWVDETAWLDYGDHPIFGDAMEACVETSYDYYVKQVDGSRSAVATVTLIPTHLIADGGVEVQKNTDGSVEGVYVWWTTDEGGFYSGAEVERSELDGSGNRVNTVILDPQGESFYLDTTAQPGVRYVYRVKLYIINGPDADTAYPAGDRVYSGVTGFPFVEIKTGFADAPALSGVGQDGPAVRLSWAPINDVNGRPAEGYEVYRGKELVADVIPLAGESAVHYVDKSVEARETYKYTVKAYMVGGFGDRIYSAPSAEVTVQAGYGLVTGIEILGDSEMPASGQTELRLWVSSTGQPHLEADLTWTVIGGRFVTDTGEVTTVVNRGRVTVVADEDVDSITVTAQRADGFDDTHTITVLADPKLTIDKSGMEPGDGEDAPYTLTLVGGEKYQLSYEYIPSGETAVPTWAMFDAGDASIPDTVATISSAGLLTTKAVSSTEEFFVQLSAGSVTDQIRVVLLPKGTGVVIERDGVTLASPELKNASTSADMSVTATLRLRASVLPEEAAQGVTWKSSSDKIASVDENGRVYLNGVGTATITATANDGSGKNASFKLEVYYITPEKKLTMQAEIQNETGSMALPKYGLEAGQGARLTVVAGGKTLPNQLFDFSVPDKQAGLVELTEDGVFVTDVPGSYAVTAELRDDRLKRKATLTIKVIDPQVGDFSLESEGLDDGGASSDFGYDEKGNPVLVLDRNDTLDYVFTLRPVKDGVPVEGVKFTYKASDAKVASVKANADGTATVTVKAKASGKTIITATAGDQAKSTAEFHLTVQDYTPVLLNGAKYSVNPNAKNIVIDGTYYAGVRIPMAASGGNSIHSIVAIKAYNTATKGYTDETDFEVVKNFGEDFATLYLPQGMAIPKSAVKLQLSLMTEKGEYSLPIEVTVKAATAKITAKQGSQKFDLLYNDEQAWTDFTFTVSDGTPIEWVALDSAAFALVGAVEGKVTDPDGNTVRLGWASAQQVTAKPNTKVSFVVKLAGYEATQMVSATVGTTTTKPGLVLSAASENFNVDGTLMSNLTVSTKGTKTEPAETLVLVPGHDSVTTTAAGAQVYIAADGSLVLTITDTSKTSVSVPISVQLENWNTPVTLTYKASLQTADKVTAKLAKTTLEMNSTFLVGASASTAITLSQVNQSLLPLGEDGSAITSGSVETDALFGWTLDPYSGTLSVAFAGNAGDVPAKGASYKFNLTLKVVDDNDPSKIQTLKPVAVTVKLAPQEPTVKLAAATLNLNTVLAGEESAASDLTLNKKGYTEAEGYSVADVIAAPAKGSNLADGDVDIRYDAYTGKVVARLNRGDLPAGSHKFDLTILVAGPNGDVVVLSKPVALTVKTYSSTAFEATATGKGTLSLSKGGQIVYTITKLTNISGEVDSVWLEDDHSGAFTLIMGEPDAKGQTTFTLKMNEGSVVAGKYTIVINMTLKGMSPVVRTKAITVNVGK